MPETNAKPSAAWLDDHYTALSPVLKFMTDIVVDRGEGSYLIDVDGRRWLDFTTGIGVTNLGHCPPEVVAAIQHQAQRLIHTSVTAHNTPAIELANKLRELTPFFDDPQVFFCNTGAEAVEGSVKLARQATGRPGIIAFRRAFHGRTLGATSLTTAKGLYRENYGPLLPSVTIAPYAYPLRYGGEQAATSFALDMLDELFELDAPASDVAAMIVEPVLGEGGYVVPPVAWLRGLRERCNEYGILLVFDEVQCGMGRTGRFFAAETFGVRPDIVLAAKGIASGMPLGAIIAERSTKAKWPMSSHGSTFGGNPLSCVASLATIEVIERDDLLDRTREVGSRILERLRDIAATNASVIEVRGIGLMIGIEFDSAQACERVQSIALDEGLVLLTCGPRNNVLRLIPPLNASDAEIEEGLTILDKALRG